METFCCSGKVDGFRETTQPACLAPACYIWTKLYCFKAEEHYQQQKSAPVVDMNVSFNVTWHKCGFMSMGIVNDVMTGVSNMVYYAQSTIMVM